jgi:hypothetical protein
MYLLEPKAFQCSEVIDISQLRPQRFKDRPVSVAGRDALILREMVFQISLYRIVIEQRVVDIEQKDNLFHLDHVMTGVKHSPRYV